MLRFRNFTSSTRGNVSVMFAIAMLGISIAAGTAIDIGRRNTWASRIQTAADAAALAATGIEGTEEDRKTAAMSFFDRNFVHTDTVSDTEVDIQLVNDAVTVRAKANLTTSFMGLAGITQMPISATSVASAGETSIEIALVLDVSGSMRHSLSSSTPRIDVLRKAAKSLVDIVSHEGQRMGRVKVGIVPFNMNVNVGTNNAGFVQGTGNILFAKQAWAGCVVERASASANSDSYDATDGAGGRWHAYAWPPEPNSSSRSCVNRSDGTNTGYAVIDNQVGYGVLTRGPNYNCVRHPLMPLSGDYDTVMDKIDELTAEWNMGTIIAPGVAWGLRVLSPDAPFTEGAPYDRKVQKYMIVLTDGEQTTEAEYGVQGSCYTSKNTRATYQFNPSSQGLAGRALSSTGPRDTFSAYGYILNSDPFDTAPKTWSDVRNDLYDLSLDACGKVKAAGGSKPIEVFTIAVSDDAGNGTTVGKLLQTCASSQDNFFLATDDLALMGAFGEIAGKINQVRLTE